MEEYAELRAQRLVAACKSGRSSPHAHLPASGRSRTPGGSSRRVLAGKPAPGRGGAASLRRACAFLPASIEVVIHVQTGDLPGPLILCKSVCLWCLSAHSGPPLAASQDNSRARTLRSLSASVTRVVLSGPCPSPRARSSLLLWFVVLPLPLVKGKHSKPSKETP